MALQKISRVKCPEDACIDQIENSLSHIARRFLAVRHKPGWMARDLKFRTWEVFVCLFELMFYIDGKQLRSCWDGLLLNHTVPGQAPYRQLGGLYYLCGENKGADQLHCYRVDDLRLCFHICKNPSFLGTQLV